MRSVSALKFSVPGTVGDRFGDCVVGHQFGLTNGDDRPLKRDEDSLNRFGIPKSGRF
jgi:hypothetical protein